jgi:hypothetical protein
LFIITLKKVKDSDKIIITSVNSGLICRTRTEILADISDKRGSYKQLPSPDLPPTPKGRGETDINAHKVRFEKT